MPKLQFRTQSQGVSTHLPDRVIRHLQTHPIGCFSRGSPEPVLAAPSAYYILLYQYFYIPSLQRSFSSRHQRYVWVNRCCLYNEGTYSFDGALVLCSYNTDLYLFVPLLLLPVYFCCCWRPWCLSCLHNPSRRLVAGWGHAMHLSLYFYFLSLFTAVCVCMLFFVCATVVKTSSVCYMTQK